MIVTGSFTGLVLFENLGVADISGVPGGKICFICFAFAIGNFVSYVLQVYRMTKLPRQVIIVVFPTN